MKRSLAASIAIITGVGLGVSELPPRGSLDHASAPHGLAPSQSSSISAAHAIPAVKPGIPVASTPLLADVGPDSDIVAVESSLDQAMLDALVHSGRLHFELPDGTTLELFIDSIDEGRGYQRIRVRSTSGGSGQFTRAAQGFFGTIATDRGVYAFENQGFKTYIVNHSELDRRNLPGLSDVRRPREA